MVALRQLPAVILLGLAGLLVFFQVVAFCIFKWRTRGGLRGGVQLCGPWQIWVDRMLTAYPLLALLAGIALPVGFGVAGLYASNFGVDVNLDFSTYLGAELEERYLFDLARNLGREQIERSENLQDRGQERWASWNFVSASLASDSEQSNSSSSDPRRLQVRHLQVNFWKLDIFYQAKDPEKGVFTREALEEIRDFEGRLLSFPGYTDFCRKRFGDGSRCDPHYSATNIFFSVPDATATTGDEMQVIYDGSGALANIDDVLEGFLRDGLDWWVDKDFGPQNMKSQYTRASFFGGLPLPGYPDLSTRQSEQREKSANFLKKIWTDLLHRSELSDGLNYEHITISWHESRYLYDFEVMYYLISDCWLCLGTMITVVSMVLFRQQNLFTTFFGVISVVLAFVATYYFHYVVMGYQRLTVMDLISIFLIIAIAADNILLLYNTYHLAPAMMADAEKEPTPAERMRWAYRKASLAMLVTSATTCGSFYANMLSIVTVVRGFGFFMGTLVLWNFVNVLTIFPASILVSETYLVPLLPKRCRSSRDEGAAVVRPAPGRSRGLSSSSTQAVSQDPSSMFTVDSHIIKLGCVERLMDRRLRHCLVRGRWLLLLASLSLSGLSVYLAIMGFQVASGEIVVFESDLNLGRMQALISEVFPSYDSTDLNVALAIANPLAPTTLPSCARLGDNSTWCSGQGWCNTFTGRCTCEEQWVGTGCSVPRKNSSLQLFGSFEFLHIFARPSLIESPGSLDFTSTADLVNGGDDVMEWSLSVPASSSSWMGVVPTLGAVPGRSFSADDQLIFDGRGSFVVKYFTGNRPAGFSEAVEGILDVKNLGTQTVRFAATLMQPPALAALAVELWELNVTAALTPSFALDFGFTLDDDTLNLALPGLAPQPWYNASVPFEVERIAVKTELFGTASEVEVNGERSTGGLSQPIALEFVEPESNEIFIRVFSAVAQVPPTVYKLEVVRDPPPTSTTTTSTTTTSTTTTRTTTTRTATTRTTTTRTTTTSTKTTTEAVTLVAGDISIQVSDCALLSSEEQQLVSGLASMLGLPTDTVRVEVRCSRRVADEHRRRLASSAVLRYELQVPDTDVPALLATLDAASPGAVTTALQGALDQGSSGVTLSVTELAVDGVTRTSTSSGPSTTSVSRSSSTRSSSTATLVTSTATTVTMTSSTSSSVTATTSTVTMSTVTTSTVTTSTVTTRTVTISTVTISTVTTVTSTSVSFTSTTVTVTSTSSASSTSSSTGAYVIGGSIAMDVSDCDELNSPSGLEALRRALAEAAGVDLSEVGQITVSCARRMEVELHEASRRLQSTDATVTFVIEPAAPSVNTAQANLIAETSDSLDQKIQDALLATGAAVSVTVQDLVSEPLAFLPTSTTSISATSTRTSTSSSTTSSSTTGSTTTAVDCPGTPVCGGLAGECVAIDQSSTLWRCECSDTYEGPACENRTCPSCQNNGSCVPGDQSPESQWTCACPDGFEGENCHLLSCPNDCSNSGDCDSRTGSCTCFPGYSGEDCSVTPNWKVPFANCIEIHLTWGLNGHKAYNASAPDFNSGFDLFAAETQAWLLDTCRLTRATPELLVRPELQCWIEAFQSFVNAVGGVFPVPDPELASQALQAWMHRDDAREFYGDVSTTGVDYDGRVNFAQVRLKVNVARNDNTTYRRAIRQQWEDFVAERNNGSAPGSVGPMLMVSGTWVQMEMESKVVASTFTAFLGSITVSLLAVALFTQNVVIALYVCLNILLVVCILAGFLLNVMGYEFGVAEAIGATIFVGLSVDYCLHLAHAYNASPGNTSRIKMRHTLVVIGPSILGGAATTVAGTAFLLPCRILLFQKLGWSLFANALVSILLTFCFLCPMLIILGPTGRQGDLCPCLRRSAPEAASRRVSEQTDPNEVVLQMAPEAYTSESTFHLDAAALSDASEASPGPPQVEVDRALRTQQSQGTEGTFDTDIISVTDRPDGHRF